MIPAGLFLADTSAMARVGVDVVRHEMVRLGRLGLLASCVTIDLEVLYSARSPAEYLDIADRRDDAFTDLPLAAEIGRRARSVQAMLARTSQHRAVGVIDLLTAACAEHYGATVLHYDQDFDHVAAITGQPVRWVVPAGTVP